MNKTVKSYYAKLLDAQGRAAKKHPKSYIAVDAINYKVVAHSKSFDKLRKKLSGIDIKTILMFVSPKQNV